MNSNKNDSTFEKSDDYLHEPDERLKWRESYYFNWIDIDNNISGFSTLGIVPNEKKREFVFILFKDNKREVYYREPDLAEYNKENFNNMLSDKKLQYELIEPLKEWNIKYNSRKYKFQINFKNRHQPYYFGKDSSASWHRHFESSGIIEGSLVLRNGDKIKIRGFGQRDKSWGYRDWHEFDKWYAGHFQFRDWASGFRKDYIKGTSEVSGYIWNGQKNIPLKNVETDVKYDDDTFNSPIVTNYTLIDISDNRYKIRAERISDNSFIRFARDFEDGYTELFEQMVIMTNLETDEVGTGMSEELRTELT
jgi:hypothetical protein